jgi:ATP-dependent DNA ligase
VLAELISWSGTDADFHRLGRRMLHGDTTIAVTVAFDVLALDGESTIRLPYTERHALREDSSSTRRRRCSR